MNLRLGARAGPPRSPKVTKPSLHSQTSRVIPPIDAPVRAPRRPVRGNCAPPDMFASIATSCIETSTICGRPDA